MDAFFTRFVTEGTLLNLVLVGVCVMLYRLYNQTQKARDEDRRQEQQARKADADSQAAALNRMSDALTGVKSLLDVIDRQVARDK
jgi:Tfp pilus assembly protein PilO